MLKKFFQNAGRPSGRLGKRLIARMNGGSHAALARWGLEHLALDGDERAIDLGCGGGDNVYRLAKLLPNGRVTGLDSSDASVERAIAANQAAVDAGRCEIVQGDVVSMPFPSDTFDIATAFETIYFWKDVIRCFAEVYRVLRHNGIFMITNASDGRNLASQQWVEIIDGMKVYTADQLTRLLLRVGFVDVEVDDEVERDRICVLARK